MCREDDFEDEPEPSLLETLVKKAEEMAKNIRQCRNAHHESKLDSLEDFRSARKRRTSLNSNKLQQIVLENKIKQKKTLNKDSSKNEKFPISKEFEYIKQKFESYEKESLKKKNEFD